jgi:3-deoxy-D-manno-octulosonic-acid transferase
VAVFLAQSEETAKRLRLIGAPRVELTGNIKYDARPGKETPMVTALRTRIQADSVVVVCGSTLDGEETIILGSWPLVFQANPRAVLVLAPRHPARFDQVATLIKERGIPFVRASNFIQIRVAIKPGSVILLDTIGDLAAMYGLAEVAFVGGSLVDAGGHNPLEPAQFGVPVLMGPSFENFREIVEAMQATDGIRIIGRRDLADELSGMMRHREESRAMGARGRAVSEAQSGAAARTAAAILKLLPPRVDAGARR